jgi:hypothetical protein
MFRGSLPVIAVAAVSVASSAHAAVVSFTSKVIWDSYVTGAGASIATEDFNSFPDGFYASAGGSVGGIAWTASAAGGLYFQSGQASTNSPETLSFTFAPGVNGVSGNIYATDINFTVVPSIVQVTLSDGSSYIGYTDSTAAFVGFYSTGASISSLSVTATDMTSGNVYPTVNNLYFASVPAPGALALVGLAGMTSRRRVRR